jgi:competence protein ComEC
VIRRPLFWSSLAFAGGLLARCHPATRSCWESIAAALLAAGMLLAIVFRTRAGRSAACLLIAAGWGACGAFVGSAASARGPESLSRLIDRHPERMESGATLRVELIGPPAIVAPWPGGCQIEAPARAGRVTVGRIVQPVTGLVGLRVPATCEAARRLLRRWKRGDVVEGFFRMRAPRGAILPGEDPERRPAARGIEAFAHAKSARLVRRMREESHPSHGVLFLRAMDRLRGALLARLEGAFDTTRGGRRAAAVSAALLVGERSGLDPASARRLQEAGLSHLLAVSGFNVAILAGLALALCAAAGVRGAKAAALCLPVLAVYLLINREESSVARAVIMAAGLMGAWLLGLRADARNALGLAAIALLAAVPQRMDEPGFQLTFVATLALIESDGGSTRTRGRTRRAARALVHGTFAAMAATTPLVAWHFNRVSPGAFPSNLAAGPIMSFVFLLVIAIAAPVWPAPIVHLLAAIARRLIDAVFAIAGWSTSLPVLSYRLPDPPSALVASTLAALALAAWLSRRGKKDAARAAGALWGALLLFLAWPIDRRAPPEGLRVTAFDVGQGDAVLLESGSARVLVDTGGSSGSFDVGEQVVSRSLWRMGIARIDLLVLTHADFDHAGGAAAVVRNFHPPQIWVPAGWRAGTGASIRDLAWAIPRGTWLREVGEGDAMCLEGTRLAVIHPPAGSRGDPGDNERSIVLTAPAAGGGALLMGDAGARTEALLRSLLRPVRLLKVGHHGSRGATTPSFLATVRPRVALVSCGRRNRFGHPHPETLERLRRAGSRVVSTRDGGAVSIELGARGTRIGAPFRDLRDPEAWE